MGAASNDPQAHAGSRHTGRNRAMGGVNDEGLPTILDIDGRNALVRPSFRVSGSGGGRRGGGENDRSPEGEPVYLHWPEAQRYDGSPR